MGSVIPVLRPSCSDSEIEAVTRVLRSNWWGQGDVCDKFERKLAFLAGYEYCVTVNSATAALHLALLSSGIGPGQEVIVPAMTFVSTALAVVYCGATPVFADITPDSLCIDWDDVARKITRNTTAVIPVDYAGYPAAHRSIRPQIPSNVVIIEDAAHMPMQPHYGDIVCYSFHPVKPLATGDGGAILTNSDARDKELRALRWCGINRSTWERATKRYTWDYQIEGVGYKCHWNDLQAAIGLAQLERYESLYMARATIAKRYLHEFSDLPGLQLPLTHENHAWHLFVIRVEPDRRNVLLDYLSDNGISASVHYKPLTYYAPFRRATPPITEREWRRSISLPIFADLTDEQQTHIITTLRRFYGR